MKRKTQEFIATAFFFGLGFIMWIVGGINDYVTLMQFGAVCWMLTLPILIFQSIGVFLDWVTS